MQRAQQNDDERRRLLDHLKDQFFLPPLLEHKYNVEQVIGEGAYGVVCSAVDTETGEKVAVKRIMRVFEEAPEATRTLRELKFLRLLKSHENIITVKDVLLPSDRDGFDDVFVVLELMPTDLTRVLRSRIELSAEHIRWLIFQLMRGIFYLHTSHVFHRDLKPSNILINARCDLRIVDFGLSRAAFDDQEPDLVFWTDYVATRWYRAPELIMAASTSYTTAIDMWSVGCIFAEMLNNGHPMFPGRNPEDQLQLIVNFCGTPSAAAIAAVREPRARALLTQMPPRRRKPLQSLFPHADPQALDLLDKILVFDPAQRMSAEQALNHPYLLMDSVTRGTPIDVSEFAFERQNLSISQLRALFIEEILKYHPERREMYMRTADDPVLRYSIVDQAARFREQAVAVQDGREPPRMWESMPNQRLTKYVGHAASTTGFHRQHDSGGDATDPPQQQLTASTTHHAATATGSTAADNQSIQRASDAIIRSSRPPNADDRATGQPDSNVPPNEEHQLMRYGKFSSVESASSAMAFRHDSGQLGAGVAGRRVSETLESMADVAQEIVNEMSDGVSA